MKKLKFEPRLAQIVNQKTPVFAIIIHHLTATFDLHKGTVSDPNDGHFDKTVLFTRDSDGEQWKVRLGLCFIDED